MSEKATGLDTVRHVVTGSVFNSWRHEVIETVVDVVEDMSFGEQCVECRLVVVVPVAVGGASKTPQSAFGRPRQAVLGPASLADFPPDPGVHVNGLIV